MKTVVVQSQQRWEYMVVTRRSEVTIVEEANIFGQKGWELVSILNYKDPKGIVAWSAFLKRPCSGPGSAVAETSEAESNVGIATHVADHAIGSAISHDAGSAIHRGSGIGSSIGLVSNGAGSAVGRELKVARPLDSEPEADTFELQPEE
jgi:hypothetical protein